MTRLSYSVIDLLQCGGKLSSELTESSFAPVSNQHLGKRGNWQGKESVKAGRMGETRSANRAVASEYFFFQIFQSVVNTIGLSCCVTLYACSSEHCFEGGWLISYASQVLKLKEGLFLI
jgi:hypothetical protein